MRVFWKSTARTVTSNPATKAANTNAPDRRSDAVAGQLGFEALGPNWTAARTEVCLRLMPGFRGGYLRATATA